MLKLLYIVVDLKLKQFAAAVEDCNKCLNIEPQNVKALMRKADALRKDGKMRDVWIFIFEKTHLQCRIISIFSFCI